MPRAPLAWSIAGLRPGIDVLGGTLLINGTRGSSASRPTRTRVTDGSTLGGIGTIFAASASASAGRVEVQGGGMLSPGDPAINDGVGTLTIRASLSLLDTSRLIFDLANVTTVGAGISDLLVVDADSSFNSRRHSSKITRWCRRRQRAAGAAKRSCSRSPAWSLCLR